jgi:uncharacterized membrane protein
MPGLHDGGALARAQEQDEAQAQAEARARQRALAKLGFYKHLALAGGLSLLFLALNLFYGRGHWWFVWPVLGLGLSVAWRAFKAFGGAEAEEELTRRLQERELRKERQRR